MGGVNFINSNFCKFIFSVKVEAINNFYNI